MTNIPQALLLHHAGTKEFWSKNLHQNFNTWCICIKQNKWSEKKNQKYFSLILAAKILSIWIRKLEIYLENGTVTLLWSGGNSSVFLRIFYYFTKNLLFQSDKHKITSLTKRFFSNFSIADTIKDGISVISASEWRSIGQVLNVRQNNLQVNVYEN